MYKHKSRYRSAEALHGVAVLMQLAARQLFIAAKWWHAWLEQRRVAAIALEDFARMSARQLADIGLSRADVHRVALGVSDRYWNRI